MAKLKDLLPYTSKLSLLYIEEDEELLYSVSDVLKNLFVRVDSANDANDGVGYVKFNNYDLIIVDSISTIMSVHQLIDNLKTLQPNTKVIVTVKSFTDEQLVDLYKLGIHSIIKKPFAASNLLDNLLDVTATLHHDRNYLQSEITTLNTELLYERKRIGRLLLSEKKLHDKIKAYENSIHINKNIHELTRLPSRYALQGTLGKTEQSLLYINIDHFDFINSIYGMGNANKLLKETGLRLKTFLPNNAELYHITADEFVILIDNPAKDQASLLASQIQALFKEAPVEFEDNSHYIVFSIGIDNGQSKILFVNAKSASKEARFFGGDQTVYYSSTSEYMQEQRENLYWIRVLRQAFDEDKIFTYYQPIINNKNPELRHYEVLCRLMDEDNNLIDASKFMKSARLVGLITQITKTVIDKTFKEFKSNNYNFSINISRYDLHEEYLIDFLEYKCERYGIARERIYLEIVEDIIISHSKSVDKQIIELKEMGYNVIIDDFGSDKSTFSRMFDLQVDYIKIDGAFIKELDNNKSYRIIVQSIVDFAKQSGIKTIAEHIENKEVLNAVKELGIDYSQGYLLGKPSLSLN